MVQAEVQPSSDNLIVRAAEIPAAAAVGLAGNSTGDVCFVIKCFF